MASKVVDTVIGIGKNDNLTGGSYVSYDGMILPGVGK